MATTVDPGLSSNLNESFIDASVGEGTQTDPRSTKTVRVIVPADSEKGKLSSTVEKNVTVHSRLARTVCAARGRPGEIAIGIASGFTKAGSAALTFVCAHPVVVGTMVAVVVVGGVSYNVYRRYAALKDDRDRLSVELATKRKEADQLRVENDARAQLIEELRTAATQRQEAITDLRAALSSREAVIEELRHSRDAGKRAH